MLIRKLLLVFLTTLLVGCQVVVVETQPSYLESYLDRGEPVLMCPTVARAVALKLDGIAHPSCRLLYYDGPRFYDYWVADGWFYAIYMVGPILPGQRYFYRLE